MNLQECKNNIDKSLPDILILLDNSEKVFIKMFNIERIFSSDDRGKIRLSRTVFAKNHKDIEENILQITTIIEEQIGQINETLQSLIVSNSLSMNHKDLFFIENEIFLNSVGSQLEQKSTSASKKREIIDVFKEILFLKDKVLILKYYIGLVETGSLSSLIDSFSVEELINSTLMFDFIDAYAMKLKKIESFKKVIENFDFSKPIYLDQNEFEILFKIYKRKLESYILQDVQYKIVLEYDIKFDGMATYQYNIYFLELILHFLIEQSCVDLIKKELKKAKFNKLIEVDLLYKSGIGSIVVKNNGFDTKDLLSTDNSGVDSVNLINIKNFLPYVKFDFEANPVDNEGMQYKIKLG